MFGRRRHAAVVPVVPVAPVPQLTDAQILELVHEKVSALIGVNGEWSVTRRSADDTDTLFHTVLATSVSLGIATAITDARRRLETGDSIAEPQHLAEPAPAFGAIGPDAAAPSDPALNSPQDIEDEPAAFTWEPAPITVWTDLRKPVTGEFPAIAERSAA
jgi:hypothetical protein